jgi:hypothetical protein
MRQTLTVITLCLLTIPVISLTGCTMNNLEQSQKNSEILSAENKNGCESACTNYVDKCLKLVPGATQQLYVDGLSSCLEECKNYPAEKITCLTTAENCPTMTVDCEL